MGCDWQWSKPSTSLGSLRDSCASMRKMSAMVLEDNAKGFDENMWKGGEQGMDEGYVEFLPVEWFDQVGFVIR